MNKKIETIPSGMMKALCDYDWPGNVRGLQNVIERAVILSSGTTLIVPTAELRDRRTGPSEIDETAASERRMPVHSILADVDCDELIRALAETKGRIGVQNGAAARFGLKRTTFITRMKRLGIDRNQVLQVDEVTVDTSGIPKISDQEIALFSPKSFGNN